MASMCTKIERPPLSPKFISEFQASACLINECKLRAIQYQYDNILQYYTGTGMGMHNSRSHSR
jgi:hypothetical protein